ncbi:hexadecenal dehydrogenase SCDLUD_004001 [Saccharomycodes ludwigii]|uniref:hexadecenal dehydrogenase n=1 Tax=Saccharomycodes ludwigii TaxID=36035 RepID=UPI001E8588E3|nr:hypothetical protein SCDLUD_004001 [Saccharomycodes ludwigii]KAH3899715.1 hypothetical protein SCDLUD_004001 [Saccharomycodes ludwigii]
MNSLVTDTPLAEIRPKLLESKAFHLNHLENINTPDEELQYRLQLLRDLYFVIKDNESAITDALIKDFHRSKTETYLLEISTLLNNITLLIANLPKWFSPVKKSAGWSSVAFLFSHVKVERIPLGTVCVISPCNFPVLLSIDPIASALAGGNSVVWKPSELTPQTSALLTRLLTEKFGTGSRKGLLNIVCGGVPETTELLKNTDLMDKIFYTGSTKVGKIVSKAAAENLVPVTLELGGKSPVFVTEHFNKKDLTTIVKRIFFGAFSNSGQVCVACDYLLVHESIYDIFLMKAKEIFDQFYKDIDSEAEFTHLINRAAYNKIQDILQKTEGDKYSIPGINSDEKTLFVPPTLIFDVTWDDSSMLEENFGPILPILKYSNLTATLKNIVEKHDTPLVQYIYSNNETEIQYILRMLRSGGCSINDSLVHVGFPDAPFGGIKNSGIGGYYHGEDGYDCFTNKRTIFKQPFFVDKLTLDARYPPYGDSKIKLSKLAMEPSIWFKRTGDVPTHTKSFLLRGGISILVLSASLLVYFFFKRTS